MELSIYYWLFNEVPSIVVHELKCACRLAEPIYIKRDELDASEGTFFVLYMVRSATLLACMQALTGRQLLP